MDAIKASCPKCSTQYQLTPAQLAVANGQVRCGACMTIFQAVPAKQPVAPKKPPSESKPSSAATERPGRSSFVNDEDDILLKNTGVRKSFNKTTDFETGEFDASFENLDATDDKVIDDIAIDDDAIFDDDTPLNYNSSLADNFSDEFSNNDDSFGDEIHLDDETGFISETALDDADESWAEQLLDDDDIAHLNSAHKTSDSFRKESDQPRAPLGAIGDDFDFDADLEGLELGSLSKSEEEDLGFYDKDEMIGRITPEPLEFHLFAKNSLVAKIAYSVGSFLAICLLVIQIFYFQFDTLSRDPNWRPLYETSCGILGCKLAEQYSIQDISAKHLTVKSHPYYKNALIVDTIITNHADILQPFPKLELYFTDTSDKIVSARQFSPDEYLRGELANASLMPSKHSIHIALEINDPGVNASGYWIQLVY